MENSDLEIRHRINLSLVRPRLIAGVELLPLTIFVAPSSGFAFILLAKGGYTYGALLAILSIGSFFAFKHFAKDDPYMFAIFFRAWQLKKVYAPRPTLHKKYQKVDNAVVLKYMVWACVFIVPLAVCFAGWKLVF